MKTLNWSSFVLITALVVMAESADGTQPPDSVVSDSAFNTATGTSALLSLTTGSNNTASGAYARKNNTTGIDNSASGVNALQFNTTGSDNTASGVQALYSN